MRIAVFALVVATPLGAQDVWPSDAKVGLAATTTLVTDVRVPVTEPSYSAAMPIPLTAPLSIDPRLVPLVLSVRVERVAEAEGASQEPRKHRGRYGAGLIGFGVGALAGVGVAAAAGPYDCACEDPGLEQALIGIGVGGLLGAGIGAALPGSDVESCSRGARIGRGIVGSIAGAAVFVGVGALIHPAVAVFSVPFTAPLGASFALRSCH